jgi:hypothetical protein
MATTEDPSEIGNACQNGMGCGPGYTCQPFNGFVLQETCQILCADPCECPDNHACVPVMDKGDAWMECHAN